MTKKNYIWCLAFAVLGCGFSTVFLDTIFDFGQEKGIVLPLILGGLVVVQIMELVLERLGKR